jgi:hypothetical protein
MAKMETNKGPNIIDQRWALANAMIFEQWAKELSESDQELINAYRLIIKTNFRNVGDMAANELLAQVFVQVRLADLKCQHADGVL